MKRYAAFLRGINVGGHATVKMEDLRRTFAQVGLKKVTTYQASGNVVFESDRTDVRTRIREVTEHLSGRLHIEVEVFLRSEEELRQLVRLNPFRFPGTAPGVAYVTFVRAGRAPLPPLPVRSPKSDIEVFLVRGPNIFSWGLPSGERSGYPTQFVEKMFGEPGTTRKWATVEGMASRFP
ncbi:MAG: DUF1697 domain-containing protein [Thermoplasmata archaeon]|nr:DUF1697 domain-containing protein [Thermoplasmata archaeon]